MESNKQHPFDLERRTTEFAKQVILLCRKLPRDAVNTRLVSQVVGSSGSIGANYREANDALGAKDFVSRLRISRREAKETMHWLELIETANPECRTEIKPLNNEAIELCKILSTIIKKNGG
ncbi:MAG: four helix bundle protein [bacterium]|nr:four helix bundle protein [bacterium]